MGEAAGGKGNSGVKLTLRYFGNDDWASKSPSAWALPAACASTCGDGERIRLAAAGRGAALAGKGGVGERDGGSTDNIDPNEGEAPKSVETSGDAYCGTGASRGGIG